MSAHARKYMITGATGHLGRGIVEQLLKRVPATEIAVLVRDPIKSNDLAALGVEIRQGDYADVAALDRAFSGVEKLMFVSTTAFTDALRQHRNVVDAATKAGIQHVYYTAIQRPERSSFAISQVTEWDRATEAALAASGMDVTLLRNTMYFDALPLMLSSRALVDGLRAPAGNGLAALAARPEMAEATAILLSQRGHAGKTYTLGGSDAVTMADIAKILSKAMGQTVPYHAISAADFIAERSGQGVPESVAGFIGEWFEAIAADEFAEVTGDLERILDRRPLSAAQYIPAIFGVGELEGDKP
jgi:NAD(P)H dehydrogenase (quinone)